MKKPKINIKLPIKKKKVEEAPAAPSRITNDTVAEHREQVLAGGRKFKYPVQYVRRRLVINAVIITVAALIVLGVIGWWQLYPMQNTSTIMYRVTRVLPLPVAKVNGELVQYSDYLAQFRSSEHYLSKYGEIKLDSDDGKRQLSYFKRQSMDKAIATAYANQIAREKKIKVTSKDVDQFIEKERNTSNGVVSQETYDASIMMLYGQTPTDYRSTISSGILKNRIAFALDDNAAAQIKRVESLSKTYGGDFAKVAADMAGSKGGTVTSGQSGLVKNASKFGGLRVSEVAKLEVGGISAILRSDTDDGYYIVKVIEKTETETNFTYVHVPLTQMKADIAKFKKEGKIVEYIKIEE